MANQWFKFYGGEYLSDPKIDSLSVAERSCWITLLCLASSSTELGVVRHLSVDTLLRKSGIIWDPYYPEEWDSNQSVLEKFSRLEMITKDDKGAITILNWEKRQEHNLTVAERVAKHRKSKDVTTNVTNVTTEENRIEENIKGNLAQIPPSKEITEIRIDSEGKEKIQKPKQAKDTRAWKLREEGYDFLEEDRGVRPTPNGGDYTRIIAALKTLDESQVRDLIRDEIDKGATTIRGCLTDKKIYDFKLTV